MMWFFDKTDVTYEDFEAFKKKLLENQRKQKASPSDITELQQRFTHHMVILVNHSSQHEKLAHVSMLLPPNSVAVDKDKRLGMGGFGVVNAGEFNGAPCAVKQYFDQYRDSAIVEATNNWSLPPDENIVRCFC